MLQLMIQGKVQDISNEPDTDKIDLQDFKYHPGDTVSVYQRKTEEVVQY